MKVLAGLVRDPDIFQQRKRDMFRQNLWRSGGRDQRLNRRLRHGGSVAPAALLAISSFWRWFLLRWLIEKLRQVTMPRSSLAGDGDSALFQDSAKKLGGKLCRVLNSDGFAGTAVIQWQRSPQQHLERTGIVMNSNFSRHSRRAGHDAVVHFVITGLRVNGDQGFISHLLARMNADEQHIIVEAEGGDWS